MENTKEIVSFYEEKVREELEAVLNQIKREGFSEDAKTSLRLLEAEISRYNAAEHFYGAWHSESDLKRRKGA